MSSWKGQSRGGAFGHLFFVFVLKYLNLSIAYFVLRFVAAYFLVFSLTSVKSLYSFYKSRLSYGVIHALLKVYQNFYLFGQIQLDKVSALGGWSRQLDYISEGENHIQQMTQTNSGGLLITSHFGGWALAGNLLEEFGIRPKILMLEAEHNKIKKILARSQKKQNLDIIPVSNDLSDILQIAKNLREKDIIAIHGDRFLPGSKTIRIPFLGKSACFPLGPFFLAAKFKVPVSFVFTVREKNLSYRCIASPLYNFSTSNEFKNQQEIISSLVEDYVKWLEKFVKQYPEQWFNYYDFWKNKGADGN